MLEHKVLTSKAEIKEQRSICEWTSILVLFVGWASGIVGARTEYSTILLSLQIFLTGIAIITFVKMIYWDLIKRLDKSLKR